MKYNLRVDDNQKQIVLELRAMGYSVRDTHRLGQGFPDLAIGKNGFTCLVEVKQPGEKLTADEREFFDAWRGLAIVGTTSEQIDEQFTRVTNPSTEGVTCPDCLEKLGRAVVVVTK